MSLPFGGYFYLGADWHHAGHDVGLEADIRYFNSSESNQDLYDGSDAAIRIADIQNYYDFSLEANAIANSPNIGADPRTLQKQNLLQYCVPNTPAAPRSPCTSATTMVDMNTDMIIKICEWYEPGVSPGDGRDAAWCPSVLDLSRLKRFSKWVEINSPDFTKLVDAGVVNLGVSSGQQIPGLDRKPWEWTALTQGKWPDGREIFKVDPTSNKIINADASTCLTVPSSCSSISSRLRDYSGHFSHVHLDLGAGQ